MMQSELIDFTTKTGLIKEIISPRILKKSGHSGMLLQVEKRFTR